MRIFATIVLAVIASAPTAFAQSLALPRGLVGVSATFASTDASSRMRLGSDARPWIYSAEVSARIASRVAIGAEAIDFGIATGETRGISFRSTGEQRERAIVGLLRARAGGGSRVALDLVGGAGVLFQRHLAETAPCVGGCAAVLTTELTNRAPAFVVGAELPIQAGRNFPIAAIGRYYFLRRGDHTATSPTDPVPWQFEYQSSNRLGVGVSARVTW